MTIAEALINAKVGTCIRRDCWPAGACVVVCQYAWRDEPALSKLDPSYDNDFWEDVDWMPSLADLKATDWALR